MSNQAFKLILSLLTFFYFSSAQAQILKPVKWSFSTEALGNNEFNLVFTAEIEDKWTVYSQFTDDSGPVPTELTFETIENGTVSGLAEEFGHKKEGIDKIFEVNVIKYLSDKPFVIKQKIVTEGKEAIIAGYLTYMTCDNERCLPPQDLDFTFTLPASSKKKSKPSSDSVEDKIPNNNKEATAQNEKRIEEPLQKTSQISTTSKSVPSISFPSSTKLPGEKSSSDKILKPVTWDITKEKVSDTAYLLHFKANIQSGWTVYSQHTSDDGPVPTEITYENKENITLIGESEETGHKKEGPDKFFDNVIVIKYLSDEPFEITQSIKLDSPDAAISGYLTFMACDDSKCIFPPSIEFEFTFGEGGAAIAGKGGSEGVLKDRLEGNVIDQTIPTILSTYKNPLSKCGGESVVSKSYFWVFIFGFIGGLLALLTPCVFPMIPITVSFFTKDTKRSGVMNGIIYGASIIVIYVFLGLLITILLGPEALNRLSTNWIANTAFFIVFIAFAFSFFGFYEITLPSSWTTGSDRMADRGGLLGIFFMAFTLALVSFSCTGPIIGTALVQAASQGEYVGPFLVMFGFSLALALPFGLFAAFPAWLNTLPKSGGWMNSVKVFLGFLELALAFKFLTVADLTSHWGILRYELFMGIWIVIFLGLAGYLFGLYKFPHDSPVKKLSLPRKGMAVATLAFSLYLLTGFMVKEETNSYNALPILSGIAPPANYNYFLPSDEVNAKVKKRFPSYTKCANNIDCFKDYYDALAYAKEINKPILLDFTGYGCVNCRKTEEHIWVDPEIRRKLNDEVVLASLYVDDDSKLEKTLISKARQEKLRNIGNKWADFQILNFEQNSQPLYVLISPDEEVISAPRPFKEGIEGYNDFLDCGLNSFKKMK